MSIKSLLLILMVLVLFTGCTTNQVNEENMAAATGTVSQDSEKEETEYTIPEIELPDEKRLSIPVVYSGYNDEPALCYLGAYAMAAMNERPELDFSDIVAASGTGTGAKYRINDYISNGLEETALIYASENLGLEYVLGLGANGIDSDYDLPHEYRIKDRAKSVIYFNNDEKALKFLKAALTQKHAPVVHLDMYYLKDELSQQNDFWNYIPKEHNSHFMTLTGYDGNYIYLNDPTSHNGGNLKITVDSFLDAWKATENFDSFSLGPYWVIYPEQDGDAKTTAEIIDFNKRYGNAPEEMKKYAESGEVSEFSCFLLNEMGRARSDFADYLNKNGMTDAASVYHQLSDLYGSVCSSGDRKTVLLEISDLEQKGSDML